MAEAIVSLAIERISALLIHEAGYLGGVREEVERLKAELERMNSFLKDAEYKQDQTELLRTLVRQIRDLAYEAEDVIDSYILEVAHQGGSQGIMERFASTFTKPSHLHKMGVQIKGIQTKLEDISKSLPVYDRISGGEGSSCISWMLQQRLRTYPHVEEVDVVSLEGMTKDVVSKLMKQEEEDRLHVVVSIVGMGGIGKTTLAKKVYNHIDVKRHFDCCAWVFISQKCMPREVLHDVLVKVHPQEQRQLIDKLKESELMTRLFDVLKDKRFLVVFDDVWRSEDWNNLKPAFPRGRKGSKILFTTRNKDVALLADPCNCPIELPFLTEDESWSLFKRKAFPGNKTKSEAHSREFEMLGREMLKKCGGLPLAIVVLGGLLATKKSLAEWKMVQRNFHAHLNKVEQQDLQYGAVNGILVLSYNDLPFYLKPCFLYLGHYPEDWEISKKELIRLWIAEGFISPSLERGGMLMEDVAEQFLEELINRCLVQVGKRDYTGIGVKSCHIHDLLRDLCLVKAREENFLEILQVPLIENYGPFLYVNLSASMLRRIAIHPSKRYACLKVEHPNLHSLLLFQNEKLIELHISKRKNFKFLRVLKVVKVDSDKWAVSSEIGNLHHLSYLGLLCSGEIILPQSIKKLQNLQTLHVRSVGLTITPNGLFELVRLRHILLVDDAVLSFGRNLCLSTRFNSKTIETLKYIRVENLIENNTLLNLINIQSLGIIFTSSKDVELILKVLLKLHRLRSLDMRLLEDSIPSYPDLEPLSRCHHLSKLFLRGKIKEYLHSSHHALKFVPRNIAKLTLRGSKVKRDPMAILEKLPHLRILHLLADSYMGTKLICSANGFLHLDSLLIDYLPKLEEWRIEEGAMPRLRSLHLKCLLNLRMLPEGLRYNTALQEMKLGGIQRSLVERIQVIDGREGEDFNNVRHIPSIQIFNTIEDRKR